MPENEVQSEIPEVIRRAVVEFSIDEGNCLKLTSLFELIAHRRALVTADLQVKLDQLGAGTIQSHLAVKPVALGHAPKCIIRRTYSPPKPLG